MIRQIVWKKKHVVTASIEPHKFFFPYAFGNMVEKVNARIGEIPLPLGIDARERATEGPQRWVFEMSYESGLSASLHLRPSAASAAICRRNLTLCRENRENPPELAIRQYYP
ncbi:hypothetical protein HZH68_009887 [Vespula germanica]|uniref:Uncharacterized protein n=1 Tax=Vespula germanica TaxID=30212 RepID=A0A834N4D1_VESGE|nr:hypothetical protein HZH68_009887 [Vespula germanica]